MSTCRKEQHCQFKDTTTQRQAAVVKVSVAKIELSLLLPTDLYIKSMLLDALVHTCKV